MALSADHGSSMVRCTRLRWLTTAAKACKEMPVLAASDTMATISSPLMKAAATAQADSLLTASILYIVQSVIRFTVKNWKGLHGWSNSDTCVGAALCSHGDWLNFVH